MRDERRVWYNSDGVHLNRAGYDKLADLLPVWLRLANE